MRVTGISGGVDAWSWRVDARCRSEDLELFFHPEAERGEQRRRRQERAKQICAQCPVIDQCRAHCLEFQEPFGTWGGLSENDRTALLPNPAVNLRTHRDTSQLPNPSRRASVSGNIR